MSPKIEIDDFCFLYDIAHRLVDDFPEWSVSWFAVGSYYYLTGKQDLARRYLSKATQLDRLFGPAWLAYGHSFARDNEHDQAMAAYFKALQLMKGCHLPLLYIGVEYGLTNNAKLAEKFFKEALAVAPEDPFVLHELGVVAFQNHDYSSAEVYFADAFSRVQGVKGSVMSPRWEPLLNNMGHVARKLGRLDEALELHRRALALKPVSASSFAAIGHVLAMQGEIPDAAEAFHAALGVRRDDTFATTMLSTVVEQMASGEAAVFHAVDPNDHLEIPLVGQDFLDALKNSDKKSPSPKLDIIKETSSEVEMDITNE